MTKFKIYLLICTSIVMLSVCNAHASAEAGNDPRDDSDTRTASSASSSSDLHNEEIIREYIEKQGLEDRGQTCL